MAATYCRARLVIACVSPASTAFLLTRSPPRAHKGHPGLEIIREGFKGDPAGGRQRNLRQGFVHHAQVGRTPHGLGRENLDHIGAGLPGREYFGGSQGAGNDADTTAFADLDHRRFENGCDDKNAAGVDDRGAHLGAGDTAGPEDDPVAEMGGTALDDLDGPRDGHRDFGDGDAAFHQRLHGAHDVVRRFRPHHGHHADLLNFLQYALFVHGFVSQKLAEIRLYFATPIIATAGPRTPRSP